MVYRSINKKHSWSWREVCAKHESALSNTVKVTHHFVEDTYIFGRPEARGMKCSHVGTYFYSSGTKIGKNKETVIKQAHELWLMRL